jgi:hypothetical protein
MRNIAIIVLLFVSSATLALVHETAIRLNWFYTYQHIDTGLHLLGGVTCALFGYAVIAVWASYPLYLKSAALGIFWFTLCVALGWELFEYRFGLTPDSGYTQDTLWDILLGLVGAGAGWLAIYSIKNVPAPKTSRDNNKEER